MMRHQGPAWATVVVLLLGGAVCADEVRGVVQQVDPDGGTVTLRALGRGVRGTVQSFQVTRETRVTIAGKEAALAELKPGTRVHISFESANGRNVARAVTARGLLLARPEPGRTEPVKPDEDTVAGTVARISFTEREVVVVGPGSGADKAETLLSVPENASVTRAKKAIKLDDVREGEAVVARTEMKDGKRVVVSMEVGAQAKPATGEAPRGERLRAALKIAEFLLDRMGQRQAPPEPQRPPIP